MKVARVQFSAELVGGLIHLPQGSRIVGADFDDVHARLVLTIEHDSLPELIDGDEPVDARLVLRAVDARFEVFT